MDQVGRHWFYLHLISRWGHVRWEKSGHAWYNAVITNKGVKGFFCCIQNTILFGCNRTIKTKCVWGGTLYVTWVHCTLKKSVNFLLLQPKYGKKKTKRTQQPPLLPQEVKHIPPTDSLGARKRAAVHTNEGGLHFQLQKTNIPSLSRVCAIILCFHYPINVVWEVLLLEGAGDMAMVRATRQAVKWSMVGCKAVSCRGAGVKQASTWTVTGRSQIS